MQPVEASVVSFESSLRKGLGRSMLLLRQEPDNSELNAVLLRACTEDQRYDRACETGRVPYLHQLILATGQVGQYRSALRSRLQALASAEAVGDDVAAAHITKKRRNIELIFGLLCRLAAHDGRLQAILREFVLTAEDRELGSSCAPELVRLEGISALLACAHRFSPEIREWPPDITEMADALAARDGLSSATAALQQARRADVALNALFCLDEDEAAEQEAAPLPTYDVLKAEMERGGAKGPSFRWFPYAWIMGASQVEIDRAATDLIAETDKAKIKAYLGIFRRRAFPGDPTVLFPLLGSADRRIEFDAANVLGRISHPAIRDLAFRLIAEQRPAVGARVLRSSRQEGDLATLTEVLNELIGDEDTYHGVGLSVLDMLKHSADGSGEARQILLHIYENGPCSGCRGYAVDLLAKAGCIPEWMVKEGRYDAEPSIAERFRLLAT